MEKTVRVFRSFQEADAADREYYRNLTPEQRLRILFNLVATDEAGQNGTQERLQRVCRVIERRRR
jgi:hypothetical protein